MKSGYLCDTQRLLLHGFVDGGPVVRFQRSELVNAANSAVSHDEGTRFKLPVGAVLYRGTSQPGCCGATARCNYTAINQFGCLD